MIDINVLCCILERMIVIILYFKKLLLVAHTYDISTREKGP